MTTQGNPRFTELKIDGIPPFKNSIEFSFDPEVNVFIGPQWHRKVNHSKIVFCISINCYTRFFMEQA